MGGAVVFLAGVAVAVGDEQHGGFELAEAVGGASGEYSWEQADQVAPTAAVARNATTVAVMFGR